MNQAIWKCAAIVLLATTVSSAQEASSQLRGSRVPRRLPVPVGTPIARADEEHEAPEPYLDEETGSNDTQQPTVSPIGQSSKPLTPDPAMTPEELVHARASQRAMLRKQRIATRRWYGISAARPAMSTTPLVDPSATRAYPTYRWGGATIPVAVRPRSSSSR